MTATIPSRNAEGAAAGPLAPNYHPLPVTLTTGEGAWVRDTDGRTYLDMLAGYSALNFGHRHPALIGAAKAQLDRLTLSSRAFDHDLLYPFAEALSELARPVVAGAGAADGGAPGPQPMVLPMNTGAEAVETAIKAARKWGYDVRGVAPERATIVVAAGNFHGRTTTIVSFSTDPEARDGFAPHTPGFRVVPFGDAEALRSAVDETTVAVLLEPIQGEQGVVVPPAGYWPAVRSICDEADVLLIADEIQSGLGRTGTTFALELWGVRADLVTLGKALGGGVLPVSAVVGRPDVLGVLTAGTHGSTFGGNPLACAVGIAVVDLLLPGLFQERARALGAHLHERLATLVDPGRMTGRELCERLLRLGVLAKDTHGSTIRLAPPLVVEADDLDLALDRLTQALR